MVASAGNKCYIKEFDPQIQCKATSHKPYAVPCRTSGGAFLNWRYITEANTISKVSQRSRASGRSIVPFWPTGGSQLEYPALPRVRWLSLAKAWLTSSTSQITQQRPQSLSLELGLQMRDSPLLSDKGAECREMTREAALAHACMLPSVLPRASSSLIYFQCEQ